MTEKMVTTSLVLPPSQIRLLKKLAASRMMRGVQQTASVSEVVRELIEQHEAAFLKEIEGASNDPA